MKPLERKTASSPWLTLIKVANKIPRVKIGRDPWSFGIMFQAIRTASSNAAVLENGVRCLFTTAILIYRKYVVLPFEVSYVVPRNVTETSDGITKNK